MPSLRDQSIPIERASSKSLMKKTIKIYRSMKNVFLFPSCSHTPLFQPWAFNLGNNHGKFLISSSCMSHHQPQGIKLFPSPHKY